MSAPQTAADCEQQVRLGSRGYTSVGFTDREATRLSTADRAECHDTGIDPEGLVFPEDPTQVAVWSFLGYPTETVLGVRVDRDTFRVFVADSASRAESERISTELDPPQE